jgi:hypothetical protein
MISRDPHFGHKGIKTAADKESPKLISSRAVAGFSVHYGSQGTALGSSLQFPCEPNSIDKARNQNDALQALALRSYRTYRSGPE